MMLITPSVVLFVAGLIIGVFLTYYFLGERTVAWFKEWKTDFEDKIRKDVIKRSRAALKGKIGEQLAPLFPRFNHEFSDARFIGSPIDYVIFEGLSEGNPEKIVFADIKTGKNSRLTSEQRDIREIVERGEVKWETIRMEEFEE